MKNHVKKISKIIDMTEEDVNKKIKKYIKIFKKLSKKIEIRNYVYSTNIAGYSKLTFDGEDFIHSFTIFGITNGEKSMSVLLGSFVLKKSIIPKIKDFLRDIEERAHMPQKN